MRIDAPAPGDVKAVALAMRERDEAEFLAVSHAANRAELADALEARYGAAPSTICAYGDDGAPVAVGAMVEARPNVVTLMFFATDRFPTIGGALTRFIRNRLFPAYKRHGVHRIECASLAGYDAVHRWIEAIGLRREADLKGYGRDGEDFVQFAWVADARPART